MTDRMPLQVVLSCLRDMGSDYIQSGGSPAVWALACLMEAVWCDGSDEDLEALWINAKSIAKTMKPPAPFSP